MQCVYNYHLDYHPLFSPIVNNLTIKKNIFKTMLHYRIWKQRIVNCLEKEFVVGPHIFSEQLMHIYATEEETKGKTKRQVCLHKINQMLKDYFPSCMCTVRIDICDKKDYSDYEWTVGARIDFFIKPNKHTIHKFYKIKSKL